MKGTIAFALITLGTVGAAFGVARTDPSVDGWVNSFQVDMPLTLISLAVLVVGIVMSRAARKEAAESESGDGGSLPAAREALAAVANAVDSLGEKLASIGTEDLHAEVDAIVTGPVTDFVENRNALTIAHGIGGYAAVMGPFAQGERYLNRAWSASTDGYRDEAVEYARRAGPAMREARDLLRRLSH